MGESRGLFKRLKDFDNSLAAPAYAFFSWFAFPVAALFCLYISLVDIGPELRAIQDDGVHGTITITRFEEEQSRYRTYVDWYGIFRSDDGTITRVDTRYLLNDAPINLGDKIAAIDTGHRLGVLPIGGTSDWLYSVAFILGSSAILVHLVYRLYLRRIRHLRRGTKIGEPHLTLGPRSFGPLGYALRSRHNGRIRLVRSWEGVFSAMLDETLEDSESWPTFSVDGRIKQHVISQWGEIPLDIAAHMKRKH